MSLYRIDPNAMRGSGTYYMGRAGEALSRLELVYKNPDGRWYLADADAAATMPTIGITMGPALAGQVVRVLKEGYIGRSTWAWTVGGEIYASSVPGALVQVPPAAPSLTQVVGMATRRDMILFDPSMNTLGGATITGYVGDYTYLVNRVGA